MTDYTSQANAICSDVADMIAEFDQNLANMFRNNPLRRSTVCRVLEEIETRAEHGSHFEIYVTTCLTAALGATEAWHRAIAIENRSIAT